VIVGYDYGRGEFLIQGAFEGDGYKRIPIPQTWSGPTLGPLGWATNPIFVLGPINRHTNVDSLTLGILGVGLELMRGGKVAYGRHPSEHTYMAGVAQRQALYGLPALELLEREVETVNVLKGSDLDFGLLWRIDSQLGQFEHDRSNGALFLDMLKSRLPADGGRLVLELSGLFEASASDAKTIRRFFWQPIPETIKDAGEVAEFIESSQAIVFALGSDSTLANALEDMGYSAYKCPWGWVVVADSEEKRLRAKTAVHSALTHEKYALEILEQIRASDLGKAKEPPKTGKRRRRRPKKRQRR